MATERNVRRAPDGTGTTSTSIVVAVSGGTSSWRALDWAAAECLSRRSALRILHVVERPVLHEPGLDAAWWRPEPRAWDEGAAMLRDAVRRARTVAPDADISTHLEFGNLVAIVSSAGRDGACVVIGKGHPSGFGPLSRAWRIVRRANGPITVVELDDGATHSSSAGRVVVGVEAGVAPSTAVTYACQAAASRGTGVTLIVEFDAGEPPRRRGRRDDVPRALVQEAILHRCLNAFAGLDVRWRFPLDSAEHALVRESAGAALLVLGRPARARLGDVAGRTLSYNVFREARCPVALVRTS